MDLEPEEVIYHDDKDGKYLTYRYPNGVLLYHNYPKTANMHVVGTPGEKRPAKPVPSYKGQGGIYGDFMNASRRAKPFRHPLAVNTMSVCHRASSRTNCGSRRDPAKSPPATRRQPFVDRAQGEPWIL
jgi:hypothetical protein